MSEDSENRFESKFFPGRIIGGEGPGKGFASYPWILDDYERVLDLSPEESWLLHRMLKHAWKQDTLVHISMARVCRDARISRPKLDGLIKSLLQKGYIAVAGRGHSLTDHRVRYDVSGVITALAVAVMMDPDSKWGQAHGAVTFEQLFRDMPPEWTGLGPPGQVNAYFNARGQRFNWCSLRLEAWAGQASKKTYQLECEGCGAVFTAGSKTAKRCAFCRELIRQVRWQTFREGSADPDGQAN